MRCVPLVSSLARATPLRRLWFGAGCLAAFLLTLVIGNFFVAPDRSVNRNMLGHDFLAFYTAGSFIRAGRPGDLYDLDSVKCFEQATAARANLETGKSFGPWWNPPFYAMVFAPLAGLPYMQALDEWRWISVTAAVLAAALLTGFMQTARGKIGSFGQSLRLTGLVPVLMLASMPFIQAFSHGQNTFTSLLLLTGTVALWRAGKSVSAGLVAGLLFYKPQLAAVVAGAMVLDLGWPALLGLGLTGLSLLAVNLVFLPGSIELYLHQLPLNVKWMQIDHDYLWERHVTIKAFWRLLLQGRHAGEAWRSTTVLTAVSLLGLGLSLGWSVWRRPGVGLSGDEMAVNRDRKIAAAVTTMPLLMPFYFDYDLLLLAVPLVLYAAERVRFADMARRGDRWLTLAWAALYLWLFVNPATAMATHVSGTILLLTTVAALTIHRATRQDGAQMPVIVIHPQRLAMAA